MEIKEGSMRKYISVQDGVAFPWNLRIDGIEAYTIINPRLTGEYEVAHVEKDTSIIQAAVEIDVLVRHGGREFRHKGKYHPCFEFPTEDSEHAVHVLKSIPNYRITGDIEMALHEVLRGEFEGEDEDIGNAAFDRCGELLQQTVNHRWAIGRGDRK